MATTLFGWRPSALVAAHPSVAFAAQVHLLGRSAVSSPALAAVGGGVARGEAAVAAAGYGLTALATNPANAGRGAARLPFLTVEPGKAVNGWKSDNSISANGTTVAPAIDGTTVAPAIDGTTVASAIDGATTSSLSDAIRGNEQQLRIAAVPASKRDLVKGGDTRGIPPRGRRRV
jgi:hypothetical protein